MPKSKYDINLFDAEEYETIKSIMPVNIPHTISKESCEQYGLHFETMREVLPMAVVLYENIERMTEEVFGDAETPR